ncbi:MAG: hypothetical protein IJG50_08705 [Clostridia bacterium]|nr:hypothetical protein [Clostridia bacterium]
MFVLRIIFLHRSAAAGTEGFLKILLLYQTIHGESISLKRSLWLLSPKDDRSAAGRARKIQIEEAEREAQMNGKDVFTYKFENGWSVEGESFDALTFNFGKLTARDSLAAEAELRGAGVNMVVPKFSGEYLIRIAARACETKRADGRRLGSDVFMSLPLAAFSVIRSETRSFLLRAGS